LIVVHSPEPFSDLLDFFSCPLGKVLNIPSKERSVCSSCTRNTFNLDNVLLKSGSVNANCAKKEIADNAKNNKSQLKSMPLVHNRWWLRVC